MGLCHAACNHYRFCSALLRPSWDASAYATFSQIPGTIDTQLQLQSGQLPSSFELSTSTSPSLVCKACIARSLRVLPAAMLGMLAAGLLDISYIHQHDALRWRIAPAPSPSGSPPCRLTIRVCGQPRISFEPSLARRATLRARAPTLGQLHRPAHATEDADSSAARV